MLILSFIISLFINLTITIKIINTIRMLIVNPGKVFRDFFSGKRKPYYKPIPFFILLTAIYLILRTLMDFDPLEGQMVEMGHEDMPEIARRSKEASRFMVNNINNIMFFLVFSIGLILKLFFRKQYNLAEYTTVGFFITGMYIIFGIFSMIASKLAGINLQQIQLLFLFLLIAYSSYSLIQRLSIGALLKYGLVSMLSILFYMIFGFGFSYLVISFTQG